MPESRVQGYRSRSGPERRLSALTLAAAVVLGSVGVFFGTAPARAAEPGTDSAVTVSAADYDPDAEHAPFPDLKVTVSQTRDLIQQGIRVSWTGGKKSDVPTGQTGGANFLQIMQCWGDEPGSGGRRPDRTTCQYGGFNTFGATRWSYRSAAEMEQLPEQDLPYTAPGRDFEAAVTGIPFRSATGKTLALVEHGKRVADAPGDVLYNNEFYTRYTTNETSWAGSGTNRAGSVSFELQTAQQSPGLGCGDPREAADGAITGTSCWLVVIPRGDSDPTLPSITRSGLFWDSWKHHIAIRLGFKPIGLHCDIGAAERQLVGSELVLQAVGQWQPVLCGKSGGAVYSLLVSPESASVSTANGADAAPLALTSRALDPEDGPDDLAYAPIALTGVSVAFAIDRYHGAHEAPEEVAARDRQAFESLKLTPRLLAKLLTASYQRAVPNGADKTHLGDNPSNLTQDPDFLAVNDPEWRYMALNGVGVSDVLLPFGRMDAATAMWEYILADPQAADFLAGKPDEWGMVVNPYYSTNEKTNPTGVALMLPRDEFPKADPSEYPGTDRFQKLDNANLVTWRPYASSLDTSGYLVLRGDALKLGDFDPLSQPPKYGKAPRDLVGLQQVMGVTDSAAAAGYQVVQAALRNPAGEYVVPTTESFLAAAAAMTPNPDQPQVLGLDLGSQAARDAAGAYPLTVPVYAAANPELVGDDLGADYAAFIDYAVTDGQDPGTADGQLPPGYAPLPEQWRQQALTAAAAIRGVAPTPTPTPTPTPSPTPTPTPTRTPTPTPAPTPTPTDTDSPPPSSAAPPPQAPPEPSPSSSAPAPTGDPAGPLTGAATPQDPSIGSLGVVVPATGLIGLAAVLGVPAISRVRRLP